MGYLGEGRLGVKGCEMGELDKKVGDGRKKCQGSKTGRNSKLSEGAGRFGEIKYSDPPSGTSIKCISKVRIFFKKN